MKERNNKQSEHNQGYKKNWENCKYFVNNNGGLTQQDVRKKRTAKRLCVTSMTDCMCCYILHLILLCSDLLQKDLLKVMQHLAAIVFETLLSSHVTKGFAIFFPPILLHKFTTMKKWRVVNKLLIMINVHN